VKEVRGARETYAGRFRTGGPCTMAPMLEEVVTVVNDHRLERSRVMAVWTGSRIAMKLCDKVAVITGSGTGVGESLRPSLCHRGSSAGRRRYSRACTNPARSHMSEPYD
jgi:hypothetical protein